jgi:hypothetical protein
LSAIQPGIAAHHLDHHHAAVGGGRRVQPVDALGRERNRGVEPERDDGLREVVVDRLRYADDADALLRERVGDREGAVAAHRHHGVDARRFESLDQVVAAVDLDLAAVVLADRVLQRVARIRRADDRAAEVRDPRTRSGVSGISPPSSGYSSRRKIPL